MKKTTSKAAPAEKSASEKTIAAKAPAKKTAAKAEKPVAAKVEKASVSKADKRVASVKEVKETTVKNVKVAPKTESSVPAVPEQAVAKPGEAFTTIIAAIDVGFGNTLTLRGEGPGLSWDVGLPMECVGGDRWSITLPASTAPVVCKFLINDTTWCVGDDYTVLPGATVEIVPRF